MSPVAAQHLFFQANGLRHHALEWGNSDGAAIVLLHGLRSYAATWAPVAEKLGDDYRLIALDHRGRGDSDWDVKRQYFTPNYVSDVEALVAHLGLKKFILVGHSMGGTNALVYAMLHPEQVVALVVEDMGPGASASGSGAERIRREVANTPVIFADWAAGRAFWRERRPMITQEALDSRMLHSMKSLPDGTVTWKYDAQGIAQARLDPDPARVTDLWPAVKRLQCPTLLLRGAESDFLSAVTAKRMVDATPWIEWHDIPAASHYVHDDNPCAFLQCIGDFIKRVAPVQKVSP
jgi:pimeloyl-ACP methyl ester carboxylesterase